jgi:hypothetical protein
LTGLPVLSKQAAVEAEKHLSTADHDVVRGFAQALGYRVSDHRAHCSQGLLSHASRYAALFGGADAKERSRYRVSSPGSGSNSPPTPPLQHAERNLKKLFGNALAVLVAAAACTSPFLLRGFPNTASDLHQALMARALSGILFWQHGFYSRVPQLLSGFEPWSSGLFSPKLDSLFMNWATSSRAITAILFARCALFITLLSTVFYLRYGAQFRLSAALASCALVGLNVLGWLYFWPDYLAGGTFGLWGYVLFPILLIPQALERRMERLVILTSISFAAGLLYGMTTTYPYAVFGGMVAAI